MEAFCAFTLTTTSTILKPNSMDLLPAAMESKLQRDYQLLTQCSNLLRSAKLAPSKKWCLPSLRSILKTLIPLHCNPELLNYDYSRKHTRLTVGRL